MVHLSKDRHPSGTYNKLNVRKVDPFSIIQKINDNIYVIGLPSDLKISKTFNVKDIFECHPSDATDTLERNSTESNSSEEREN